MVDTTASDTVTSLEQLDALYGDPNPRALTKEVPVVTPLYARLIAASPFAVLATHGPQGIDCSPRGDTPGFVQVLDEHTLLVPDRRGNNRLDTLRNLVHDPAIALLFMIPGMGETVRVRGTATISTAEELRARFEVSRALPATVLVVHVERVYFQCQRALVRSHLWDPERHATRSALSTAGQLQADGGGLTAVEAAVFDADLVVRVGSRLFVSG
jgi:PPOX class probable FMN-dependent enzyme